jgi:endonuclease YncB( thermonuclease family)
MVSRHASPFSGCDAGCAPDREWRKINPMRARGLVRFSIMISLTLVAAMSASCFGRDAAAPRPPSYPGAKAIAVTRIEFDDGDTFLVDGKPIRFLGIDTPEVAEPDVGIFEDQPFGRAAADSTRAWILRAGVVEIATDGLDRYRRRLAHIFVDGELVAEKLLANGLAYENVSHFGDNGFPELADRILRAAQAGPKPPFEEPYKWRKKHQQRKTAAKP